MSRRAKITLGVVYLLWVVGIVVGMRSLRDRALVTLDRPDARADWSAWREEATRQSTEGPVRRRVPKSVEPPALVLMRDYFGVILAGGVLFSSLLFASLAWAIAGVFSRQARPAADR